jgi:hypothetical protein
MTLNRDQVIATLAENREAIRGFGARRLALFGSCARGESSSSSDLDFLVEFDKKSFDAYMDLKAFLEKLFGREVDLVIVEALKPRLRDAVLQEAVHAPGL